MALAALDELYHKILLDHSRNPRNIEKLDKADISGRAVNPFCGDEIDLQIRLDDCGRIDLARLQGAGCSVNRATGSMLTEAISGKTLEELEEVAALFSRMMRGQLPGEEAIDELGDLRALSGVRQFPIRIKCALLAWSAVEEGLEAYRREQK
jgi:nitrogen fixation NifU-like protein